MKILELLMRETLPQRNFFRESEVSDLLKIKPHEMRYWESEFPQVRPQKTRNGQRIYRRQDLVVFSAVKHLLLEKKLSLASAQRIIAESDDLFSMSAKDSEDVVEKCEESRDCAESEMPLPCEILSTHDQMLEDAASILARDEEDFDQQTQEIYHNCADELISVVEEDLRAQKMTTEEYSKALASLTESKNSLTELLGMLDKINKNSFWDGFYKAQ